MRLLFPYETKEIFRTIIYFNVFATHRAKYVEFSWQSTRSSTLKARKSWLKQFIPEKDERSFEKIFVELYVVQKMNSPVESFLALVTNLPVVYVPNSRDSNLVT